MRTVLLATGENYGHWNSYRENHYMARLKEIKEGRAVLLTAKEWQDKMRGQKDLRRFKLRVEAKSKEFLDNFL
ncbi:hypothetical protein FA15DRAFT_607434 [Coprinopsis marcescibilis]|uniref:Uncharacterized protein n=1 Tax=Coprinopsis marcescibilis TaxID=230819 RepID=A0A5C3K9X1_COPMA|nr:hypothetical protein FA15DRAFT_607434 [Coprinopsis marcescibilis]